MKVTKEGIFWRKWIYDSPAQQALADSQALDEYDEYECYVTWPWFQKHKSAREWGYSNIYHDCKVHEVYCFWYWNINWSTTRSYQKCKDAL